jgi:adenosylcobinamide-phosphate synthase
MRYLLLDVLLACILDLLIGDPKKMPHPVRLIGFLIKRLEILFIEKWGKFFLVPVKTLSSITMVKTSKGKKYEFVSGLLFMLIVVSVTASVVWGILEIVSYFSMLVLGNNILFHILNIFFIFTAIASKSLADAVYVIFRALDSRNIFDARKYLSEVVSRETESLSEEEIVKAAIETTSENTVDGIISPLIYAIIGSLFGLGAPFVYGFKAISTLDSMVGYKNDRYNEFGFFSAKTDDVLNFIPARLTGFIIVIAAFFTKFDYKNSLRIFLRDRKKHKSPNSAHAEAAFAGALNVTLGGNSTYFGKIVEKPLLGDSGKDIIKNDIVDAVRLMYMTFFISIGIFEVFGVLISIFVLGKF